MSTIKEIVRNDRGKAGSRGAWRIEHGTHDNKTTSQLWHYGTLMLEWVETSMGAEIVDFSTGHGSVSDQGGMNTAFHALGLNYRFDRDWKGGGARITHLPCGIQAYNCKCAWDQLYR